MVRPIPGIPRSDPLSIPANPLRRASPADPWADRSSGMRCKTCMYFVAKRGDRPVNPDVGQQGRCRRNAPTINGYPVVFEADWCGEHRLA